NAGKSNVIDSLRFLRDLAEGANAVDARGGFSNIVWDGDIKRSIRMKMYGKLHMEESEKAYAYSLAIAGGPAHYGISNENFSVRVDGEERKLMVFPEKGDAAQFYDEKGKSLGGISAGREKSYLRHCESSHTPPALREFARYVRGWGFYNILPSKMRATQPTGKILRVKENGENVSSVLHTLYVEHPAHFREIEEDLKLAVDELKNLNVSLTEQGAIYGAIEEEGLTKKIPIWSMSDGTLHILTYLSILDSPSPPPLICFEEPENYIHPHSLELLVHFMKKASERTQILVTTHSPYLLDFIDVGDIVVVEKHEGKTQIKYARDEKGVRKALEGIALGEMWFSGGLGGNPQIADHIEPDRITNTSFIEFQEKIKDP
ncbi:MAG: AAA family ATPase, partial [Candidatus Thermoplasmatota archaeon]